MKLVTKISKYNRTRKYNYFIDTLKPNEETQILDVGFANEEYSPNDNFLEKHYPYLQNITALGIGKKDLFEARYPQVSAVIYNGDIFPFADKTFDIGWCNAVIEHVGDREKQILFLKELMRTCKIVYFTTPNKYFPIELHTRFPVVHWLPKKYSDAIYRWFGKEWATGNYMNLLSIKDIRKLCKAAGVKYIYIRRNRLLGSTMDFVTIISN